MKHYPTAKLTYQDVHAILARIEKGEKQKSLAREFGVSEATISYVKYGKTYRKIKFKPVKEQISQHYY